MKMCTKCLTTKPLADFGTHPKGTQGRHAWCRACHRLYSRASQRALWALRKRHPDEFAELLATAREEVGA